MHNLVGSGLLLSCLVAAPAWAQQPPPAPAAATAPADATPAATPAPAMPAPPAPLPAPLIEPALPRHPEATPFAYLTTMRLLRDKGVISPAEYDSALRDMGETMGPRAADSTTLVLGKFTTTLYGFVQADVMYNTTQSFGDYAANLPVARPDTFAGSHGRTQFSVRDSRFGFRVAAPEGRWLRTSGVLEMDFLGPSGATTEGSTFNNPVLRIRHAYLKLETPVLDVVFGHTWDLFGWQPHYIPTDVQWSGVVGELFSRTLQLKLSRTFKTRPVNVEVAVSGARPPQRDESMPEFQGGVRLSFNQWTAVHTGYMTSTNTMPASLAVSGDLRRFSLAAFNAGSNTSSRATQTNELMGMAVAVNGFLPIIARTVKNRRNSLSLIGEFVIGQGINDLYVGLTGGVANPPLPGGSAFQPAGPQIDPGLAVYNVSGEMRLPTWLTCVVGAEYYLPVGNGRVALFANYTRAQLMDANQYANPAKVRDTESFYNAGLVGDLSEAVRFGLDYAYIDDQYADGVHATNHAIQATGFLFF